MKRFVGPVSAALLALLLAAGCKAPPVTAPPPPVPIPPDGVSYLENFNDRSYDDFSVGDQDEPGYPLERTETYPSDRRGGFLLQRRMQSASAEFSPTLRTAAVTPISGLSQVEDIEVSASYSVLNPLDGDATFGIGVGGASLSAAGYFAVVTVGLNETILTVTRNGAVDWVTTFPPIDDELELVLVVSRELGIVEASVWRLGAPDALAAVSFDETSPLRPTHLWFYTAITSSPDTIFTIDDVRLIGE